MRGVQQRATDDTVGGEPRFVGECQDSGFVGLDERLFFHALIVPQDLPRTFDLGQERFRIRKRSTNYRNSARVLDLNQPTSWPVCRFSLGASDTRPGSLR